MTADGQPIMVENADVESWYRAEVFINATPGRYRFTVLYVIGSKGGGYPHHGLDEKELAVVMTAVASSSFNSRALWYSPAHLQGMLEKAATPEEAYKILTQNIRQYSLRGSEYGGGMTWMFSNATHVIAAETTSDTVALVKSLSDGYIVQTNHFTKLKECNKLPVSIGSMRRFNRTTELIEKNYGKLNLQLATEIARDHANGDSSICSHTGAQKIFCTAASSILLPSKEAGKLVMWTAIGEPCTNEYVIRSGALSQTHTSITTATSMVGSVLSNILVSQNYLAMIGAVALIIISLLLIRKRASARANERSKHR